MSFGRSLRERARSRSRSVVFAEGEDPRVLDAVRVMVGEGLLRPAIVGRTQVVVEGLTERGVRDGSVRVLDPDSAPARAEWLAAARETVRGRDLPDHDLVEMMADPLAVAALAVAAGEADGCVSGIGHPTADVLRHALRWVGKGEGIETVSSSFYMVVPPFRSEAEEVLTFTDAAVVPNPDPAQLVDIAVAAVDARRRIVGDEPKVAFLSYSTLGSARGPAVEVVKEAVRQFREAMPGVPADGELQVDAALIEEVAGRKAPGSPLAGHANILVFPDLDAANIAYKLVERLAHATALGPIVQGLARPCNDLSRGASAEDVVDVGCITSLMAD